jgi:hypothetical protein
MQKQLTTWTDTIQDIPITLDIPITPTAQRVISWDLWLLKTGDVPGSGGNTLRGKAIWYREEGGI